MIYGAKIPDHEIGMYVEELALDPWARGLEWTAKPKGKALTDFSVTIIGAGMGGLNAAIQLGRAGIPYTVIEKNAGVGGTWYENRYPGARVDTPSRSYTHLFGADFGYPNPFCPWTENVRYFDWVADTFGLRDKIAFNTEVTSMTWDENSATWEIRTKGPVRCRFAYSPFYANLIRIDPNFNDPYSRSAFNKAGRDFCIEFLKSKFDDPELIAAMTPPHPVLSARPIMVDPEYSVLDAIKRDNVTLVTSGIKRVNKDGVLGADGTQHNVDVIVYATGFHPTEYLFPMTITGRGGQTIEQLWAKDGARAYRGCMMPGFPNLWSIYGPNTNGALGVASFHEMVNLFAMQCMERLILDGERSVEVKEDAYWRYNREVDTRNLQCVWSDPRAHNYYWTEHGRSAVMCPFTGPEMWEFLRKPDFGDLAIQ
jgi:cation diffusion facilitator CzcD-associated flavoprotein CzcO